MRRGLLLGFVITVLGLGLAAATAWFWSSVGDRAPILVGLLHAKTGPWAATEQSMLEAELLAIEEINAAGGLLGRPIRPIVADCPSDPATFARQAQRLIHGEKVSVVIGCWASEARKAVRPVVEEANHLLIYPPAYEGLEESPNIVYPGGPANQQIVPAVSWCRDVRKARSFFLVGSDSLFSRAIAAVIKDQLRAIRGELVGERFVGVGRNRGASGGSGEQADDVGEAVAEIERIRPDVVLSAVDGPDQPGLYGRLRRAGLGAEKLPVISFTLDEEEVRRIPIADVAGQFAGWNYFQSIDRAENREFIRRFQARYGRDRVVGDNLQVAYQSVRLWADAVAEVESAEVATVNRAILRQSLNAPEGIISVDSETRHGWRPFYLGKVRPDGHFEIVWSLPRAIRPDPYPPSRSREDWDALVNGMEHRN
jgi:urea transport system substrate-binding protein